MKIAIIGTGISGISMANMLKGSHEVVLFEKRATKGGLIQCERVQDCLFHKVGGHVFNSRNQQVLDWFWSFFDKENEFIQAKRKAKIWMEGQFIGYPIENYLYQLPPTVAKKIITELIALQPSRKASPFEYGDFGEFLQSTFGATLYEYYFGPYNEKIWRADLSKVAMEWLEGKLPMPNLTEVMQSNIVREEESAMVHAHFYYPKENGSQFIVDRLSEGLDIRTGCAVNDWKKQADGSYIIAGESGFDKIVYCGDIRQLPLSGKQLLVQSGIVDVSYIEQLRSNGTSNLFCETDDNDISWLYLPDPSIKAHRIIYTGNFSDTNNRGSQRKTCVVEFSGKVDYEEMCAVIGQLPGHLSPLAHNYEPNSYVIQDHRTRPEIAAAKKVLAAEGIYLLGRFAEWEYYNMDKAVEAAFALNDVILGKNK
ncbi:protoporphyrinogen/coproporphyrinogen oxidase [Pinibacter soli]|uniref:NAD(P)-binding protein n=1 Tax=Pinibacter soli TaxID=3044211 RepID=A0ABT6R7S8_9BACT|nr:NAD(P)-binding protein [Pinibacter soli]MDI3318626.1 NAD(P)-binding protein [Pinibacter soli]